MLDTLSNAEYNIKYLKRNKTIYNTLQELVQWRNQEFMLGGAHVSLSSPPLPFPPSP